ncbi:MAG: hypothetical protein LM583_01025 [Desulfurococcaceae archaeon]|nr:hypothetical protein [Desulfurococcaceae archaeon]
MVKYIRVDMSELDKEIGSAPPGDLLDQILKYYNVDADAILEFGATSPGEYGYAKIRSREFLDIVKKFCNIEEMTEDWYVLTNCRVRNVERAIINEAQKRYRTIVELDGYTLEALAFIK